VIDNTPGIPGNHVRGIAIQAWLDERYERFGDVSRFVILDDNADMAHLIPHLVQSTLDVGLTLDHVGAARNKLND
jgi:HAD domain in Swiss Army Knife RNA repair proteins